MASVRFIREDTHLARHPWPSDGADLAHMTFPTPTRFPQIPLATHAEQRTRSALKHVQISRAGGSDHCPGQDSRSPRASADVHVENLVKVCQRHRTARVPCRRALHRRERDTSPRHPWSPIRPLARPPAVTHLPTISLGVNRRVAVSEDLGRTAGREGVGEANWRRDQSIKHQHNLIYGQRPTEAVAHAPSVCGPKPTAQADSVFRVTLIRGN